MRIAEALAALLSRPIAHRGLHGCGRGGPTENSLPAAAAAAAAGFGIECDVRLSRDGEAMVIHDDMLDRLTTSTGPVAAQDAAALGALVLADGSRIPTLAALLAVVGGRVPVVVEIKGGPDSLRLSDRTLAIIGDYAGAVILESFDPAVVARCADAPCPIGLVGPGLRGTADPATLPRCDFLSWNVAALPAIAATGSSRPLTAWTVRTPAEADEACRHGAQIVFEGFDPGKA